MKIIKETQKNSELSKYKIDTCLNRLSIADYRLAMNILPFELGISVPTFYNWRKMKLNDPQDIPAEKVAMLEKFFGLKPGELANYEIDVRPISEQLKKEKPQDRLGLTK